VSPGNRRTSGRFLSQSKFSRTSARLVPQARHFETQLITLTLERLCHSLTPGCHESSSEFAGAIPLSRHRMIRPKTKKRGHVKMDRRPFAVVMLPPSEEGRGVALVGIRSDGSLDFGCNFLFTYRPTREAQKSYAMGLADMLRFKVLELSE
jgi:hypothetical protein